MLLQADVAHIWWYNLKDAGSFKVVAAASNNILFQLFS